MNQQKPIKLTNGKSAYEWTSKEKPALNHWYLCIDSESDYWKIRKDFHCEDDKTTYYKVVEYFNGEQLYTGKTLAQVREIMRDNTYRMVI